MYERKGTNYVPNDKLRVAVLHWISAGYGTWSDLARHAGMVGHYRGREGGTNAQTSELQRMLGVRLPTTNTRGYTPRMNASIRLSVALKLLERMGLDPHEIDL